MSVHHLVTSYGYLAVFALVAIEGFGIPLPGETTLIAAATYAGTDHHLWIWLVFLVAVGGAVVGNAIGYVIGDLGGFRLIVRFGKYVRLDAPKVKVAHYLFDRRGGAVVFFGRFVSILRSYTAFLAGTTRMDVRKFAVFTVAGAVAWAALYSFTAYYVGSFLETATTPIDITAGVLALVAVVAAIVFVRRRLGALEATAEAAFPGPLEDLHDRPRRGHSDGQTDSAG